MNVILLDSYHGHVSATHVVIFRVVRTNLSTVTNYIVFG